MFLKWVTFPFVIFSANFAQATSFFKSPTIEVNCSNSYHVQASTTSFWRKSCESDCSFELQPADYLELGHSIGFGTWTYHYVPNVKIHYVHSKLIQYGIYDHQNSDWKFQDITNLDDFIFSFDGYDPINCKIKKIKQ